jgi:hypothetical protein
VADFGITCPHKDSVEMLLVRRKGNKHQQFFAIGGFGVGRAKKPHQAVLVADSADPEDPKNHLAYGHLFREMSGQDGDENTKKEWAMWFNLEDLTIQGKKFDLHVYNRTPGAQKVKLGFRLHLTFQLVERAVQVVYPTDPGPYCSDGFTPYGIFSAPDTRILRVELVDSSDGTTVVSTDSSPYASREGFWGSSFSGLDATKKYRARAIGDQSTSNLSPEFQIQNC